MGVELWLCSWSGGLTGVSLEADCKNCAALCCVSLAFDKSDLFAIDKANGQVCPNLGDKGRCAIHKNLPQQGFLGCVHYTCNGAGQRVVQQVFGGQSWQDDKALLAPMMGAFQIMSRIHELLLLLKAAEKLDLPDEEKQQLISFQSRLNPDQSWTAHGLREFQIEAIEQQVGRYLKSLSQFIRKN